MNAVTLFCDVKSRLSARNKASALARVVLFSLFASTALLGIATPQVAAAADCTKAYATYTSADSSKSAVPEKALISCITKDANSYCSSKSHLQTEAGSDKKASCVNWYISGFKGGPNACTAKSSQNDKTCGVGADSRETYNKAYTGGSTRDAGPNTSSGDSGGGSSSGSGSDSDDKAATSAAATTESVGKLDLKETKTNHKCGGKHSDGSDGSVSTAIDFGCKGKGNAMIDLSFAFIRFLSNGVGLVIIASLIWGGIQYTISRGDPQGTAAAVNRFQAVFVALLIYIFSYAILNYLIPGQLLK